MSTKKAAFTLLELLLALALGLVLTLLAVPAFTNLLRENQSIIQANQLVSTLQFARSEAIKTNAIVTLCPSANQMTCGGDWNEGQLIINARQQLLRKLPVLSTAHKLIWNSSGANRDHAIEFLPSGALNGQKGSFYICSLAGAPASKAVIIENTGRIRSEPVTSVNYKKFCE